MEKINLSMWKQISRPIKQNSDPLTIHIIKTLPPLKEDVNSTF